MYIHHTRSHAHAADSSGTMGNNGYSLTEEMGKEARYKKEAREVEIYGTLWGKRSYFCETLTKVCLYQY